MNKVGRNYLKSKGLKLKTWLLSIKAGRHADILAIYFLCIITKSHCYIHLKDDSYWSTLEEQPVEHELLEQRCNLHLAYIGNGNYAQLTLCTVTTQYEIFGVPNPLEVQVLDTKPEIIGTLTADENATLDTLLKTGLENKGKTKPSASTGSSRDLE